METKKQKLQVIVLYAVSAIFLLFFGGAFSVTMSEAEAMGSGWTRLISWMWLPALLFLIASVLLGRIVLINNKKIKLK